MTVDPRSLAKGTIIQFGGWQAKLSQARKDVVFVEALTDSAYRHHAFGINHPIWKSAKIAGQDPERIQDVWDRSGPYVNPID